MTDVGTRATGDGRAIGINTPALAGLWDNRPYMHDGRYRTLDEVLANTWLIDSLAFQAAQLEPHPRVPDNALDDGIGNMLPVIPRLPLHPFRTHSPSSPGEGWTSVQSALSATDYADLKAFLLSLSSQTDPCSGGPIDYIPSLGVSGPTVSWTTPVNVTCSVAWNGPTQFSETTELNTLHSSSIPSPQAGTYTVVVKPRVRPVCGFPDSGIAQVVIPSGVSPPTANLPVVTEMSAGRPNPFNPSTTIAFSLAKDGDVSLIVYDVSGQRVRTLVDEHRKRERYSVEWDGRDDQGSPVASGVYFCRMISGTVSSTQKLVLLK